jgi:DNA-binding transcriptional MerR regulator
MNAAVPQRRRLASPDAAKYLGVSVHTLRHWRFQGGGPPYIKVTANRVVYDTLDLDRWLDERRFASTADEFKRKGA